MPVHKGKVSQLSLLRQWGGCMLLHLRILLSPGPDPIPTRIASERCFSHQATPTTRTRSAPRRRFIHTHPSIQRGGAAVLRRPRPQPQPRIPRSPQRGVLVLVPRRAAHADRPYHLVLLVPQQDSTGEGGHLPRDGHHGIQLRDFGGVVLPRVLVAKLAGGDVQRDARVRLRVGELGVRGVNVPVHPLLHDRVRRLVQHGHDDRREIVSFRGGDDSVREGVGDFQVHLRGGRGRDRGAGGARPSRGRAGDTGEVV
mmetsp:Transcript_13158/g.28466  ORF Transcript_13158/g.28466 Transcript_13158/m.28466 type:complete len:255 (+) Transcript_13158:44-808(+)